MVIENKAVLILLASYNGEKYIREQLDSIINNSYSNLKLIISDDGSTDATLSILSEYEKNYSFITVINHDDSPHGAFYNFQNLIQFVKNKKLNADYYMFSDQDDVWKEDKIEKSVLEIEKNNPEKPILVYTSKEYVDEDLETIGYNLPKEEVFDFNILHQNKTYGCTYIFNSELLNKLDYDAPIFFVNYDHYVAFQAFLYGSVKYFPQKTIFYRQHGNNVSGTVNKKLSERLKILKKYKPNILQYRNLIEYAYKNNENLDESYKHYIDCLYNAKKSRINLFLKSAKLKIRKNTFFGTIQFYLALLLYK